MTDLPRLLAELMSRWDNTTLKVKSSFPDLSEHEVGQVTGNLMSQSLGLPSSKGAQ